MGTNGGQLGLVVYVDQTPFEFIGELANGKGLSVPIVLGLCKLTLEKSVESSCSGSFESPRSIGYSRTERGDAIAGGECNLTMTIPRPSYPL